MGCSGSGLLVWRRQHQARHRQVLLALWCLLREMSLRAGGGAARPFDDDDDDDFYAGAGAHSETQRLLVREQDDTIKSLASSVSRVQDMAVRVNEELRSQNMIIGEIDEEVEKTDSRMRQLNSTLRNLANDQDRGKYCVILILLIVLAILTMLVLS